MVRATVFAVPAISGKKPVFSVFSQLLRIFSGGYGIGLVQIMAVLSVIKCHWTENYRICLTQRWPIMVSVIFAGIKYFQFICSRLSIDSV